jgi:hypothetical protein
MEDSLSDRVKVLDKFAAQGVFALTSSPTK